MTSYDDDLRAKSFNTFMRPKIVSEKFSTNSRERLKYVRKSASLQQ